MTSNTIHWQTLVTLSGKEAMEAIESERASASKSVSYSQGCKDSSQQSVTQINLNARVFGRKTPVQDCKGMSQSPAGEDSSKPQDQVFKSRPKNCARQSEAFDKLRGRPISRQAGESLGVPKVRGKQHRPKALDDNAVT